MVLECKNIIISEKVIFILIEDWLRFSWKLILNLGRSVLGRSSKLFSLTYWLGRRRNLIWSFWIFKNHSRFIDGFSSFYVITLAYLVDNFLSIWIKLYIELRNHLFYFCNWCILFMASQLRYNIIPDLHKILSLCCFGLLIFDHVKCNEMRVMRILWKVIKFDLSSFEPPISIINQAVRDISQCLELLFNKE